MWYFVRVAVEKPIHRHAWTIMQSLKGKLRERYFAAQGNGPDVIVTLSHTTPHDPEVLVLAARAYRDVRPKVPTAVWPGRVKTWK